MVLTVLDENLRAIKPIDMYKSAIWTDRYYASGDFEIFTDMNSEVLQNLKLDYYLRNIQSDRLMIIEKILIKSDVENGNTLTVSGRSLESILERRIIWGQKTIVGNLQNGIKELLNESVINPTDINRKIPNIVFQDSTDERITSLEIEAQYNGDNLYTVIANICSDKKIGFKLTPNESGKFIFQLYVGENRTYEQVQNPYVVFSPKFDNLLNSNYISSRTSFRNVALVGGEGEGSARKMATVGDGNGLARREMFVDASDISSDVGNHKVLTPTEYAAQLVQRGNEVLSDNEEISSFEGEIESTQPFEYGVDFFNGDIVQIADEYGHEEHVRIIETVMSENEKGNTMYPTYETVK